MMKHIEMKSKTQGPEYIKDVKPENYWMIFNTNTHRMKSSIGPTCETEKGRAIERNSTPNIFLVQNKGKGPPGRQRSPGAIKPNRFSKPVRFDQTNGIISDPLSLTSMYSLSKTKDNNFETTTDKEYDDYKFYKFNFFQLLNSITMKKQILFLAMFILAVFASIDKSYGQDLNYLPAVSCAPVTPLPCATDDALHPLVGKTYSYTVTVSPTPPQYIQWFVYDATTATSVITAGVLASAAAEPNTGTSPYLMSATGAVYNSTTDTSTQIDIKWQSFNGTTKQVLLVAYVKGAGGCSDNIEVYRIQPSFAFSLDIASLMPDGTQTYGGTATNASECLSPVQKATYDGTADRLTMDYGENYVFFTVTAANFVHSWTPTFTVESSNLITAPQVSDITWAYPTEAVKPTGGTWNAAATPVNAQSPLNGSIGGAGECIIVRVHLDHNADENDAATPTRNVVIGVNGVMYNVATGDYANATLKDVDPSASGSPCTQTETDKARYDLTSRPAITSTTITGPLPFIQKN